MQRIEDPPSQAKDEKQMRSVFVGNIPYDSNEDEMKDIFAKIGPIISFRIVYDRETGKPKGYGFCEYYDVETAQSAIRNLNGHEFRNRTLRVDSAVNEKSKEEQRELKPEDMPVYENPIPDETVTQSINKVMSQIPSEGILEFLQQMRECIHNNPEESRAMLIHNPQLGYSLMQALLIMKYIDERAVDQLILIGQKFDNSHPLDDIISKDQWPVRDFQRENYSSQYGIERPQESLPKLPSKIDDKMIHYSCGSRSEHRRTTKHRDIHEYPDSREREFSKMSPASSDPLYETDRYQLDRLRSRPPPSYDKLHMEHSGGHTYHDSRGSRSRDRDRSSSPKDGKYYDKRESINISRPPGMQYDPRMPPSKRVGQFDESSRDRRDPEYRTGPLPTYPADQPRYRHRGYY